MLPHQEPAPDTCQRIHTILREVEQAVLVPGTDVLAQWEIQLGQAAALLEEIYESLKNGLGLSPSESAIRPELQQIRRTAGRLQTQLEHGSNFCMGLLQARLGTGYSEHGLPVLMPTEARGTFEG